MSMQPPPPGQRPRSTPIPGEPFSAPVLNEPLTPSQFLGTPMPTDLPTATPAATAIGGYQPQPAATKKPKASFAGCMGLAIIIGAIVIGVGVAVWGAIQDKVDEVTKTVDGVNDAADEYANPQLSDHDRATLALTGGELYLWEGEGPAAVAGVFDAAIPGEPTNFTEIDIYTDYAFAVAQNPTLPDHLDRYGWRVGVVDTPEPQQNEADAPAQVFTIADLDWAGLAVMIPQTPALLSVEEGTITYVSIGRNMFTEGTPVVVRVYVTGPRSSGYAEFSADGTLLAKF